METTGDLMKKKNQVGESEAIEEKFQELKEEKQEAKDEEIVEKGSDDEVQVPNTIETKKSK